MILVATLFCFVLSNFSPTKTLMVKVITDNDTVVVFYLINNP